MQIRVNGSAVVQVGSVHNLVLNEFDIKQPVFFADFEWNSLIRHAERSEVKIEEVPKFPIVSRDLAITVSVQTDYDKLEGVIINLRLEYLQKIKLFDVFESEKLGEGKKSMAINLTFLNKEKTLTDKEIDDWMNRIMSTLEKDLQAEIRK